METLQESIKEYFETRDDIAAVYLYGSHAAGKDAPGSDVDIAVLTTHSPEKNLGSFKLRTAIQIDLSRLLRKDVDVVFMREIGEALLWEVLKNGKVLSEKDPLANHNFRVSGMTRCLDFHYYQKRMQRGMVDAMRREIVG